MPYFKLFDIGGFTMDNNANWSEWIEFYKSKFAYPNKGDILLSASGTIGRIVEYNGEKAYFQDSNIVWLNHNSSIINSNGVMTSIDRFISSFTCVSNSISIGESTIFFASISWSRRYSLKLMFLKSGELYVFS